MGSHKKFGSSSEDSDADDKKTSVKKTEKNDRKKKSSADSQTCSQESYEIPKKKTKNDYSVDHDAKREHRDKEKHYRHHDERNQDAYKRNDVDGDTQRDRRDRRDEYDRRDRRYDTSDRNTNTRNHDGNRDRPRKHEKRDSNLTQEEIAKQRKMLWSKPKSSDEITSEANQASSSIVADPDAKKAAVWTSSITAAGVGGQQASKFLKLMGIKKAPTSITNVANEDLQKEHDRQQKMMSDLDKQYQIARESTHTGRGMGLGFH